tara:strand:- start:438 stop:665 length:228 start_codon:yes stop_codon:yes gene_type:complete
VKFKAEIISSNLDIELSQIIEIISIEQNLFKLYSNKNEFQLENTILQIGVNEIFLFSNIKNNNDIGNISLKLQMI